MKRLLSAAALSFLIGCTQTDVGDETADNDETDAVDTVDSAAQQDTHTASDVKGDTASADDKDTDSGNSADSDSDSGIIADTDTDVPLPCTLTPSGPVTATADGQVIENLHIEASGTPGITVSGFADVVIRNVRIAHRGSRGIDFRNAPGLRIENASIENVGAPSSGPNADNGQNNIQGQGSADVHIESVRLRRGSSGLYLVDCPFAHVRFVEGYDFRGPMPRGQLAQFNRCPDSVLEDFSVINPQDTSWPEDNVSIYDSGGCTVRRGLIDGNNAPHGVGVMVEFDNAGQGGLIQDVDAIRMGNGCFFGYPAYGVTFERTRCRENICTDQGRGLPSSGGQGWVAGEDASIAVVSSSYWKLCSGISWRAPDAEFTSLERVEENFTLRAPILLTFCWE